MTYDFSRFARTGVALVEIRVTAVHIRRKSIPVITQLRNVQRTKFKRSCFKINLINYVADLCVRS